MHNIWEITGSEDYDKIKYENMSLFLSTEKRLHRQQGYNRIAGNSGTVHLVTTGTEEATKSSYCE